MGDKAIQVTEGDIVTLDYSSLTGRLKIGHNGRELATMSSLHGGSYRLDIGGKKVEIESTPMGLELKITARIDGEIVAEM